MAELRRFDPVTQRTLAPLTQLRLGPASELVMTGDADIIREPGIEHRMGGLYGDLPMLFDLAPRAIGTEDPVFRDRLADRRLG